MDVRDVASVISVFPGFWLAGFGRENLRFVFSLYLDNSRGEGKVSPTNCLFGAPPYPCDEEHPVFLPPQ